MNGNVSQKIRICVERNMKKINKKTLSRAVRAAKELRNAELKVLQGQRSGKVYKKPGTNGKTKSKATKALIGEYGHKLRGGQLYRASAPGEAPARRTGVLRLSFAPYTNASPGEKGYTVEVGIKSDMAYADVLENGSIRVARRPYRDAVIEKAKPEIERIFSEPYL